MRPLAALFALAITAFALASAPAQAGGAMGDLVQVEVLDGGRSPDGTYMAALRLTLSEGWKTYWRAPGDTGIPPQISWRGSRNMGATEITWPAPHVFEQNGLRSIGYKRQVVLPVEITPSRDGKPVRIKGEMDIGLCKDVCIPGRVRFNHVLDPEAGRNPAIAAALAQRPYSAKEAGVRASVCQLRPTPDGIRVEVRITMPSAGGREIAVIEAGSPEVWASEAETRRDGNVLIAASELVHASGQPYALDRSKIRITVLGQDHAVDIRGCSAG